MKVRNESVSSQCASSTAGCPSTHFCLSLSCSRADIELSPFEKCHNEANDDNSREAEKLARILHEDSDFLGGAGKVDCAIVRSRHSQTVAQAASAQAAQPDTS